MLLRKQKVLRELLETTKKMTYELDIRTNKKYLIKIEGMTSKSVITWKRVRTRLREWLHYSLNLCYQG